MATNSVDCFCSICKHRTHHLILGEGKNVSPDDDYFYEAIYRVVKCCGCDNVSFDLEVSEESNVVYDKYGEETIEPIHTAYPIKENSIEPLCSWEMPVLIEKAYRESVDALNNGSLLLASIGFRATVEALCIEKGIQKGNLEKKIEELCKKGIITALDKERLHAARFMGNESAHQIVKPDREHVLMVLEVINNILNNLYIIEKKFKEVIEFHFKNYDEFQTMIEKGIEDYSSGTEGTIYLFLPEERKYRKSDLDKFEDILQQNISNGSFSKLSIVSKSKEGKYRQSYIVV